MLLTWRDLTARRASRHRPNLSTRQLFVLTTLSCAHRRRVAQPNGSRLRCGRNGGGRKGGGPEQQRGAGVAISPAPARRPYGEGQAAPARERMAARNRSRCFVISRIVAGGA